MRSDWLGVALLLSEISRSIGSFGVVCKINVFLSTIKEKIIKFADNLVTSEGLKRCIGAYFQLSQDPTLS